MEPSVAIQTLTILFILTGLRFFILSAFNTYIMLDKIKTKKYFGINIQHVLTCTSISVCMFLKDKRYFFNSVHTIRNY